MSLGYLAVELVLRLARGGRAPPRLATGHYADKHGVDPDAVAAQVLGRGLRYGQARGAGGGRRQRRRARGPGADGEHIDDGPATSRDQVRHGQAGAANRTENLEVEVGDPVFVGDLIDRSRGTPARVVDQAVEAAPAVDGRSHEPFKVSRAGDIGLHHKRIAPGVPQPLLGGGQPARVPPADRDPGPFLDEAVRKRGSQPVGPAGDEYDLAVQVQIHGPILAQPAFRLPVPGRDEQSWRA